MTNNENGMIDYLEIISDYCEKHKGCSNCRLRNEERYCLFNDAPKYWDIYGIDATLHQIKEEQSKVLRLTYKQIAEKFGVDEIEIIEEEIGQ